MSESHAGSELQVGGTLVPDRHLYIERPQDGEVFDLLQRHEYVNILSSRQVGKSSLMMRTALKLRALGWRLAIVDLTSLGSPDSGDAYFKGLVRAIASGLRLQLDVPAFWASGADETPSQRFIRFFRDVVLAASDGPVAVFLDEIDSTLKFAFTDDLFTALRAMYNERTLVERYQHLSVCLVGVATPDELIKDRRTTPYNVGRTLSLGDFDPARDDLSSLVTALHQDRAVGEALLARVLHWTGGHPFLTARLCRDLREDSVATPVAVDEYVEQAYATLERLGEDVHVQQVLRFLEERLTDSAATFKLYQRILAGGREKDQPTLVHAELKLSGLVRRDAEGCLIVRNQIYARLFDLAWVRASKPVRETRRYRRLAAALAVPLLVAAATFAGDRIYISVLQSYAEDARRELKGLQITVRGDGSLFVFSFQTSKTSSTNEILRKAVPLVETVVGPVGREAQIRIDLNGTQVSDLTPLAGLTNLQSLVVSNTHVTDLTPLAGLTNLQSLVVSYTQVSNLAPLAGLTNLQSLVVSYTQVSDLTPLARLTNLQSLDLSDTQLTDLEAIGSLTDLEFLDVSDTKLKEIQPLENLTQLLQLSISDTSIDDLSPARHLANLEALDLSNTPIHDLSPIGTLTHLKTLLLGGVEYGSIVPYGDQKIRSLAFADQSGGRVDTSSIDDLRPLQNLVQLEYLEIANSGVGDLASLAGLTKLELLNVSQTAVSDLRPLTRLAALRQLNVSQSSVSDLVPLADLKKLEMLDVSQTPVSDLAPLVDLKELEMLDVSQTPVSDLRPLTTLVALRELNVSQSHVNDLTPLVGLDNLRSLNIRNTPVTDLTPIQGIKGLRIQGASPGS